MKREDAEKLLGAYAAGTLTAEERQALFAAALEDQRLYETLVREEPLRELLADPSARGELLAALDNVPKPWYYREVHPGIIAAAACAVVIVTVAVKFWPLRTAPPVSVVAQAELPQPAKSDIPNALIFQDQQAPARQSNLPLPPPPAIQAPPPPKLEPAVDAVLAQSFARSSQPAAPGPVVAGNSAVLPTPVPAAGSSVLPMAAAFRAAAAPTPLSVRYTILKKLPNGQFAPVDPGKELDSGDEIVIRLEPAESGFLYVLEDMRPIAGDRVEASVPYTVPRNGTFRGEGSGPREFLVVFSRQPQDFSNRNQPTIAPAREEQVGPAGAVTSVVTASVAPSPQVSFSITLKYK